MEKTGKNLVFSPEGKLLKFRELRAMDKKRKFNGENQSLSEMMD
jgi:hypothetical protein